MVKKQRPIICEPKLRAKLFEVNDEAVRKIDYLSWADEVAEKLEQGIIDMKLIMKIRLKACRDKKHLKGDIAINEAIRRRKMKRMVNRNNQGKKFKATEGLIKSIYQNHKTKSLPVNEFCMIAGISKNKYYRVINHDVEDAATVRYLKLLQKQVEEE